MYDFANSLVFITFLIYFSRWLVVNKELSDWWYNATFIFGSVAILFFAPFFGKRADLFGNGKKYLSLSTWGCFVFYTLAIGSALLAFPVGWSALFFGVGNFFYQLAFVFYNPLLSNISTEVNRGKISGVGFTSNYIGQICGMLISIPIISGTIAFGIDPILATLIPCAILFILGALPLLMSKSIFIRTDPSQPIEHVSHRELLRMIFSNKILLYFFLAFFLFSDAVTTLVNNYSIFTVEVYKIPDNQISTLVLITITSAAIGAWIFGLLADKLHA